MKFLVSFLLVLLVASSLVSAGQYLPFQMKVFEDGSPLDDGDLRVEILDDSSNPVYDSVADFNGSISNGYVDVQIGSTATTLDLNYNQYYRLKVYVNGQKLSFDAVDYYRFESNRGTIKAASILPNVLTNTQINANAAIDWSKIAKTGSSLADLATRNASNLTLDSDFNKLFVRQVDANGWFVRLPDLDANFLNYYTKSQVDSNLANYYTKSQLDNNFGFYYTKSQTDSNFLNYYTRGQIDENLLNFYTKSQTDTNFANYYTRAQADSNYLSFYTRTQIDENFLNFYTKDQTDANLANYVKTVDVNTTIGSVGIVRAGDNVSRLVNDAGYITESITDTNWQTSWIVFDTNSKAYYYTKEQVDANFLNYYTKTQTDGNFGNYTKTSDLNTSIGSAGIIRVGANISELTNDSGFITSFTDTNWQTGWILIDANNRFYYYTKDQVDTNLLKYYTKAQTDGNFNNYTKTTDLNTAIGSGNIIRYGANISLLNNDAGFITSFSDTNWETSWIAFDANNQTYYYTKTQIDGNFLNYYTKSQVDANLSNYYTKSQIDTNFIGFYTRAQIDTNLNNFYSKSEVDSNLLNYYSKTEIDTNFGNYTKTIDINTIIGSVGIIRVGADISQLNNDAGFITAFTDTNWQNTYNLLDANLNAVYFPKSWLPLNDTNLSTITTAGKIAYSALPSDFNQVFVKQADGNVWYARMNTVNTGDFNATGYVRSRDLNVLNQARARDFNASGALRSDSNKLCAGAFCYNIHDLNKVFGAVESDPVYSGSFAALMDQSVSTTDDVLFNQTTTLGLTAGYDYDTGHALINVPSDTLAGAWDSLIQFHNGTSFGAAEFGINDTTGAFAATKSLSVTGDINASGSLRSDSNKLCTSSGKCYNINDLNKAATGATDTVNVMTSLSYYAVDEIQYTYRTFSIENGLITSIADETTGSIATCFLPGTLITMADGSTKKIEDVKLGERVKSYDENTKTNGNSIVRQLDKKTVPAYYTIAFDDQSILQVTDNHPLYTKTGWATINPLAALLESSRSNISVIQLRVGDYVKKENGWKQITGWIKTTTDVNVYNLRQVEQTHTFYANDVLAHNKCVAKGALIDIPFGQKRIEEVKVGDFVYGFEKGKRVVTRVEQAFEKVSLKPLAGKRLPNGFEVTNNHLIDVNGEKIKAGELSQLENVTISSKVYDLQTTTGNYYVDGILTWFGE